MNIPRNEYPRPQFVREEWLNLNGEWEFSFDTDSFDKKITVPYVYQAKLSGIGTNDPHEVVWYRKKIDLPEKMYGKEIILHFGAVDYSCKLWVNDVFITEHIGGHISFEASITHVLKKKENTIVLEVMDEPTDFEIPRGKQYWKEESEGIFYTRSTGIWQSVWIEAVDKTHLAKVFLTPDLDNMQLEVQYELSSDMATSLRSEIYYEDKLIAVNTTELLRKEGNYKIFLDKQLLNNWNFQEDMVWTPENPRLFDVKFMVYEGQKITDTVFSYFGMRKVSIENGRFLLNNRPYYQKLLLDQGYWEDSLLTAPTDKDFIKDIELAKSMGFNGVRKHQKIEDPRFLYHADKMGFLVWGELPAAYAYSRKYVKRITNEWMEEIFRDYNHPSIVVWTPLNESWGVFHIKDKKEEQSHSMAMLHIAKSLDQTRPVISNDGWEHTCSDLVTIHDYSWNKEIMEERYRTLENILQFPPGGRPLFANGWEYQGEPILVTEFGGISYMKGDWEGWGYSSATSDEDFAQRYYDVVSPLLASPHVQGFCYTELTDVEQEINGLCTYDRKPKISVDMIRAINEGRWKPEQEDREDIG